MAIVSAVFYIVLDLFLLFYLQVHVPFVSLLALLPARRTGGICQYFVLLSNASARRFQKTFLLSVLWGKDW